MDFRLLKIIMGSVIFGIILFIQFQIKAVGCNTDFDCKLTGNTGFRCSSRNSIFSRFQQEKSVITTTGKYPVCNCIESRCVLNWT